MNQKKAPKDYLIKKSKRENNYPEIGTIFEFQANDNTVIEGMVIQNHTNSILTLV